MNIAVLITVHNRREKTLSCLEQLLKCKQLNNLQLTVYLTDDGSTDGTADAVKAAYPNVHILKGDGGLFWSGGMRLAFGEALNKGYDYYLWLNDDTELFDNGLAKMLTAEREVRLQYGSPGIVIGSTCDKVTGHLTYGGKNRRRWWLPQYQYVTEPGKLVKQCETMNGNCVLIPNEVAKVVGNIDSVFIHSMGDGDYGYRARYAGFRLWIAPGFVGCCSLNPPRNLSKTELRSIMLSIRRVKGPKEVPPKAWYYYTKRHYGFFWPMFWLLPYLSAFISAISAKLTK